ncbi:MAG: 2-oxoglutarate dehydrogenase E1 component [Parachlamydiaceae bacterium]|nr:2-oxoglutarate dehydrogenase E1 component [Parachlamydiaceae bacterium]
MKYDHTISGESANAELLETLYQQYQLDPSKLDPSWQNYFQTIDDVSLELPSTREIFIAGTTDDKIEKLINAYRTYGHLFAKTNPIALDEPQEPPQLKLELFGFSNEDLNKLFPTRGILKSNEAPLHEIIQSLRQLYCNHIGFEYKGIDKPELEKWIQHRIESPTFTGNLSNDQRKLILESLNKSELFESFLQMKYVGQKRFSLEGAETLIPMLILLIEKGVETGLEEIVLGMAHRGRLNVMSNILNKSYSDLFSEFDEGYFLPVDEGTGDVKYHKGYTSDNIKTSKGHKIKITLAPNPSHLESIDPVVEGETRAKQKLSNDVSCIKTIPILVHGDAALSGQGIVYETMQFCELPGYTTGGTIQFVVNNQIGFTTIPRDSRSTYYCTDIAKTFGFPVFHVNAEDPESCVRVALLAYEIRQKFHCDVFVDLICYRKYGHNESDEPAFTQPVEYKIIRSKKPIRELYRDDLVEKGVVEKSVISQMEEQFKKGLQKVHAEVTERIKRSPIPDDFMGIPTNELLFNPFPTGVAKETIVEVTKAFSKIPENFQLHPKLETLIKDRMSMVVAGKPIDWGMGEYLAYATLLWQGVSIRISGQDSCRGTFSHRHALWVDQKNDKEYFPLAHLKENQGDFEIYNSPLSEVAVLGFEYGYSVVAIDGLTIWEAQFGDFSNSAQVIIDQYIASGEQKWGQLSDLVLFLPHGYEGQGPEHSSGRMERYLTLAGHDNIQVVNPSTPAQFFHLLRRQVLRPLRKPLIVFTPKGLLRHPACTSKLDDLTQGSFMDILDDPLKPIKAKKLLLCSGHIFYDLIDQREKKKRDDIAIIRMEQLYPFNENLFKEICEQYKDIETIYWVQEEHQNMGAWIYINSIFNGLLPNGISLNYIGRGISATPATGSHLRHKKEHEKILNQVFEI